MDPQQDFFWRFRCKVDYGLLLICIFTKYCVSTMLLVILLWWKERKRRCIYDQPYLLVIQVTARAGTTLEELAEFLDSNGLALGIMPAIMEQTIAGAISTGEEVVL